MLTYQVLDTFPAFERFWRKARLLPAGDQIDSWRQEYLRPWPELLHKQIASYEEDRASWRSVAARRIFPALDRDLPRMRKARANLLRAIPLAVRRCQSEFGMNFPVIFVIHVGIGCGAGWATSFRRRPAVLFGLENATGDRWIDSDSAVALVEHELAHLLHARWRRQAGVSSPRNRGGPWWQLYEEGFATRCELMLAGPNSDRSAGRGTDWLRWCEANRPRIASLFLRTIRARRPVRRFFGSWYDVDGHIETGYYLGSEVIRDWQSGSTLNEVAYWTPAKVCRRGRASVRRMAADRRES